MRIFMLSRLFLKGHQSSILTVTFALVLALVVSGCAAKAPFSDLTSRVTPYNGKLKQISVSQVKFAFSKGGVSVGESGGAAAGATMAMAPLGPVAMGAAAGAAAGLGAGIKQQVEKIDATIINQRFEEIALNDYISQTLRHSLIAALRDSELSKSIGGETLHPEAELVTVVTGHGFSSPGFFTPKRKPVLCVRGMLIANPPFQINWITDEDELLRDLEIVNPDQHLLIWEGSASACFPTTWNCSEVPSYFLVEFLDDPDKIREAFKSSCDIVAEQLVSDVIKTFK